MGATVAPLAFWLGPALISLIEKHVISVLWFHPVDSSLARSRKEIGKALGVPVAEVFGSESCRARQSFLLKNFSDCFLPRINEFGIRISKTKPRISGQVPLLHKSTANKFIQIRILKLLRRTSLHRHSWSVWWWWWTVFGPRCCLRRQLKPWGRNQTQMASLSYYVHSTVLRRALLQVCFVAGPPCQPLSGLNMSYRGKRKRPTFDENSIRRDLGIVHSNLYYLQHITHHTSITSSSISCWKTFTALFMSEISHVEPRPSRRRGETHPQKVTAPTAPCFPHIWCLFLWWI